MVEEYNLENFYLAVEKRYGNRMRELCRDRILENPKKDPFQVLEEILFDMNKELISAIDNFPNTRYTS